MWRSPFEGELPGDADVSALETDVMRFMAILALCLMMVFALVQAAPPVAPPQLQSQPQQPTPEDDKPVWSLQFASDAALLQLMREQRVSLYVRRGTDLNQVLPTGARRAVRGEVAFYPMQASTVPLSLRQRDSRDAQWLVALSPSLQRQLQTTMQQTAPKGLIISAGGQIQ